MISLYTDCLALYFVKERDAMTQPKSDLAYLRSEKAKAEQQLRYYKHREKILEHQIPESFHIEHDQDVYKEKHSHKADHIIREILIRSLILCHITDSDACDLNRNNWQQP